MGAPNPLNPVLAPLPNIGVEVGAALAAGVVLPKRPVPPVLAPPNRFEVGGVEFAGVAPKPPPDPNEKVDGAGVAAGAATG